METFATCKKFDSGQTRETGAYLDQIISHRLQDVVFLDVCSLSDLANIADPDQVLRHVAYNIQRCPYFVKLIK